MKKLHDSLQPLCVALVFMVFFLCPFSKGNCQANENFGIEPEKDTLAVFNFLKVCTGDMEVVSKPYDSHGSGYCATSVPLTITLSSTGNLKAEYNFMQWTTLYPDRSPTCSFTYDNPLTHNGTHDGQGNFTVSIHDVTVTGTYEECTMNGHGIEDVPIFYGGAENEISFSLECECGVPRIKLTYPAGESPKVFTKGWVFGAECTYTDDNGKEVDISDDVLWDGTGTFKPNKGSRSYPTFNSAGQNTIELSVTVKGEEYKKEFYVEAVSPRGYARLGDLSRNPSDAHGCPACPHPVQGPIIVGSPNVSIDGLPAARAEYSGYNGSGIPKGLNGVAAACCGPNIFWLTTGDKDVLIDGFPAVRKGDQTQHCGGSGRIISVYSDQLMSSSGEESKTINGDQQTINIFTDVQPQADGGGIISGRVTDTTGSGIPGVDVKAYGDTQIDVWGALTDENGDYQITDLPDDDFYVHFWGGNWAYNEGYLNSWYNNKSSMDSANPITVMGGGSVTGIDVTLASGGSISGTVKDTLGGIEKATVGAYGGSGATNFSYTDENGEYTIAGLEDDNYQLYCAAASQGYIGEWYNDKSSQNSADPVTVTAPNRVSDIDFALSGAGGISGTVKDTSGNGIEEVYVRAFGESTAMAGVGATDESGVYEILGLVDDQYRVQFQGESQGYGDLWYNNQSGWDGAELVTVTAPNKTTGIDAELPLAGETTTTTTKPKSCAVEEIYGEDSEQTGRLRYFRDHVLDKTPEGREIIRLYCEWSPVVVKAIEEDKAFRNDVKEMMDAILALIGGK